MRAMISKDRETLPIIGLSALWPALVLSLALLAGCKTTKRVAEVQDPFLPTKTVSLPQDGQHVIGAGSAKDVPSDRQVGLASYRQE